MSETPLSNLHLTANRQFSPPAGPRTEDDIRALVLETLTRRRGTAELVIARPDARRLLGIDIDTLREEKIPGLTLTENDQQTRSYLQARGMSRRILITREDKADKIRPLQSSQHGLLTVVALPTCNDGSEVSNTNEGQAPPPTPDHLPLRSRVEVCSHLMAMPTLAAQRDEDASS